MTTFLWDQSHYDDPMTQADGIQAITHKCAEGHHFYRDTEYKAALDAARALGVPVLGAYFVNHSGTVQDQVDWFLELVNLYTPWWKEVPWMFQIDAEKFGYMDREPTIAEINGFGDLLCSRTGVPATAVFAYAPPWLYGDKLKGLKYPLWSSNYGSNPTVHYKTAYPGDTSSRWNPFSGSNVAILQYGSNTTIGNQTTCDANAWRGLTWNGKTYPATIEGLQDFIGAAVVAGGIDMPSYIKMQTTQEVWCVTGSSRVKMPYASARQASMKAFKMSDADIVLIDDTKDSNLLNNAFGPDMRALPVTLTAEQIAAIAAAIAALIPDDPNGLTKQDVKDACSAALASSTLKLNGEGLFTFA